MRQWVVALLMTSLVFAGCLGDDSGADECLDDHSGDAMAMADENCPDHHTDGDEGTGDDSGADDTPGAQTGNETGNETTGNASIGAGAYLSSDVEAGEAPLMVNFTFGVTEIPQDEFLTWTLDVDGDDTPEAEGSGQNLEGQFAYSYVTAGDYNATFVATDGIDSWNATVMIMVAEAADPEPVDPPSGDPNAGLGQPIVWEGISAGNDVAGCFELTELYYYFDSAISGTWEFKIEGTSPVGFVAEWWADADLLEYSSSGVIPAGADNVSVCGTIPSDFTLTMYHPLWTF